jgi:hypothetical protein
MPAISSTPETPHLLWGSQSKTNANLRSRSKPATLTD